MADDIPLGCGGMHADGELWAYLSVDVKPYMLRITNAVRRFLTMYAPHAWADVAIGYDPGHRLVRVLGFKAESQTDTFIRYARHK